MRALLAAINCAKGELQSNLDRHRDILRQAAADRCDIAVFPEMSLSGYTDPVKFPDGPIPLEHPAIAELATATAETGVAALFGIADRRPDATTAITQVFAAHGRIQGCHAKRHLGEGEENFAPGYAPATFSLNITTIATAICAEYEVAYPFSDPAGLGAKVVFHCSAPGLWGRRTDEASWQRGFDWWRTSSVEKLTAHARDYNLWIASAGQSGSTIDEDFPGWAALINPRGEVVAELPDWQEATLTVEIPV